MKDRANLVAALLLWGAILFNLATLWPEVRVPTPAPNDDVMHRFLVERAVEAVAQGQDPTTPWGPYLVEDDPLFRRYPHLPHVAMALLYYAFLKAIPVQTLWNGVRYLLLCTFPLSIYWAGRRIGFRPRPAALAGVISSLLATNGLLGLDMGSYVWSGAGLFTQLWGMWLLPPALAGLYATLRDGKGYAGTAVLVTATFLSHTVLGYIALLSGLLFVFLNGRPTAGRRLRRLLAVFLLVAALASYFLLPALGDRFSANAGARQDVGKHDAYGWQWTLSALIGGKLLDFGRFPSLTILAALGLVVSFFQWREERYRLAVVLFASCLLLYFGRPTWGVLLALLPMGRDLPFDRLIAGVHLGAIGLAGTGLGWLWERALAMRPRWPFISVIAITVGLLGPVYYERTAYLLQNGRRIGEAAAALAADGGAMEQLLNDLERMAPGRVYVGQGTAWGDAYRIGSVPLRALLAQHGLDVGAYPYSALLLEGESSLDEDRPAIFNLFNLRYAVVPAGRPPPAAARLVAAYGRHRLYTLPTTGYFDLVDSDWTLYGEQDDRSIAVRAWLRSGWVEARQHPRLVLGTRPADAAPSLPFTRTLEMLSHLSEQANRQPCGLVMDERVAGNTYTVDFDADRRCWLMLKESYDPRWQVTLDGRPAATAMLMPGFVGLSVEAGRHQAVFRYVPGPRDGRLLAAALVLLALAIVLERQGARWRRWAGGLPDSIARVRRALLRRWSLRMDSLALFWQEEGKWIAGLLLAVLLAGLPTLQLKQMSGHEALEYLPRAVEFYRGLQEGNFFPAWAPDLSMGYGQPLFLFTPPFVYYLAALFHVLGFSLVVSLNLTGLALLLLAGLGMYLFARDLFGRPGGMVAGVGYVMAPFTLLNLYVRYSLTDLAAMAWIPWAMWGLLRWSFSGRTGPAERRLGNARYLPVAAIAVALLTLSSYPVALLTMPVLLLYVVFLAVRARRWSTLVRGLGALFLGLALGAFFWLPALIERNWVHAGSPLAGNPNYGDHFVYLHQFLFSPWGYGSSLPGPQDGMSFGLGLAHLLLLLGGIVVARVMRAQLREQGEGWAHFWFFIWILVLALFISTDNSIALWNVLPLLQSIEFPWRALALAAPATALIAALPVLTLSGSRRRWPITAIFLALLLTGIPRAHPETYYDLRDVDYAPEAIASGKMAAWQEYEPIWVQEQPTRSAPAGRLILLTGRLRVLESHLSGTRYDWTIEADGPVQLRIATFYWPAWRLTVDGQERPPTVQNDCGLIDLDLESGVHRVQMTWGLTPLRGVGLGISAASIALLGAIGACTRLRRKSVEGT